MLFKSFFLLASLTTYSAFAQSPAAGTIRLINNCTVPGTVAVTFDDGPFLYTSQIAQAFTAAGGNVTFFVNGQNFGCIYTHAEALRAAYDTGHQIASHTWSHLDIATLSSAQLGEEVNRLSVALKKITGAVPTYFRPPYGSYTPESIEVLRTLGYTTFAMWSLDSGDSLGVPAAGQITRLNAAATNVNHVTLHHETTADVANVVVPFIISWAKSRNLRMTTLAECLGDPVPYVDIGLAETRNPTWIC